MTLTAELADPESPASRFLQDNLPSRREIVAVWAGPVRDAPQINTALGGSGRASVGGAIEWAIGLDLAQNAPYGDVLNLIPAEEAGRMLRTAGLETAPECDGSSGHGAGGWYRPEDAVRSGSSGDFLRDAWLLCQYAGLLRRIRHPDPEQWRQAYRIWRDTIGTPTFAPDAFEALQSLWRTYVVHGRDRLLGLGEPQFIRPVFDDAFAVGDLVVGGTLVDVKAYLDPLPALAAFVDQILGYVLFDTDDRFAIRSIGLYLAWQGVLLTMPLDEALRLASGGQHVDLAAARRAFARVLRPAVEKSRFYKYGSTVPDR